MSLLFCCFSRLGFFNHTLRSVINLPEKSLSLHRVKEVVHIGPDAACAVREPRHRAAIA